MNKIFVIDDKETLFHIRQKGEDETGARYLVLEEKNMSVNRNLGKELLKHKNKGPFGRTAITSRAITINNKNFNFYNGHEWDLDISKRDTDALNKKINDEKNMDDENPVDDETKNEATCPPSI